MKKKIIAFVVMLVCVIAGSWYASYCYTMNHITVGVSEDTARLTVYGQSKDYDYKEVDMNPTQGKNIDSDYIAPNATKSINEKGVIETDAIYQTDNKSNYTIICLDGTNFTFNKQGAPHFCNDEYIKVYYYTDAKKYPNIIKAIKTTNTEYFKELSEFNMQFAN